MVKPSFMLFGIIWVAACQSPVLIFSGGALAGPVSGTDSFTFAAQYKLLQLEVRPEDPYSVILRVLMHDNQLYIDAAERRRWHKYLKLNHDVRIKLGDSVYPATAVPVSDPEITRLFIQGRIIYRLVPRTNSSFIRYRGNRSLAYISPDGKWLTWTQTAGGGYQVTVERDRFATRPAAKSID